MGLYIAFVDLFTYITYINIIYINKIKQLYDFNANTKSSIYMNNFKLHEKMNYAPR